MPLDYGQEKGGLLPIMKKSERDRLAKLTERLEGDAILDQPCWSFIKEVNSFSDERLDSVAIRDGYRSYTYRQMFRYWEKYAEAFSGAGVTGKNHSRVALIGTPITETIFAFYGLNMTGASVSVIYHLDLFDEKQIHSMIEREHITDLVLSEIWAFPKLMERLLRDRELLGLRNIIVLQSPLGGEFGIPAAEAVRKVNAALFSELDGGLLMEDLLKKYEATPISYGRKKSSDSSVILHTTGTVNGMHKPVPMSDKALNAFIPVAMKAKSTYDDFAGMPDHIVSCLTLNMSWVYAMVDMLHMPLGLGMEIVCLPFGGTNPRYGEAIERYKFSLMCTSMNILDSWLKTMPDMDLSKLKVVFMGGSYVSPEHKQKFNDYLRSCGSTARIINGYGLSELGGACILSPSDRDDDAIGFLLPGFKAKILVEDEGNYYDLEDGPRTGVLLLSSKTMSTGKLDDEVFFELDEIDGEKYFNTNDLVRVNEDGSLTCIGRSNQFFINNAGVRFDAGLVQTAITAQPGIVACGLAPEFHKTLHDNVPVLYVETDKHGAGDLTIVRQALIEVFIKDDTLADSNMPSQCVLVDKIPLNTGGKVDAKRLASGSVQGKRFSVKPVKVDDKIVDIVLVPAAEGENALMGAGIPEELEHDPYNILSELFAIIPDINKGDYAKIFRIPGLRELIVKLTGFDIKDISGSMRNMMPKMFDIAFRKYVLPVISKGDRKMTQNTGAPNGFMPPFPGMPPMPPMPPMPGFPMGGNANDVKEDAKAKAQGFASTAKTTWGKAADMHKSSIDASKDQFGQFFSYMMDMQDGFADSLPEQLPTIPGMPEVPVSPKAVMKSIKEFEEMANQHFVEQTDSCVDFFFETQQKAMDMIPDAPQAADEEAVEVEAEVTEEKAE